jgi:MFS family permease
MAVIPVLSGLANRIRGMRKRARGGGRHNLWCMFIDAAGYPLAFSLISPQTVMPLYLSQLGASAFIVGLIATIDSLGLYVPQLVGAQWCDRLPVKKLYVVAVGMIERAGILGLAIATWLVGMDRPDLLIPLFFLCFGVMPLGGEGGPRAMAGLAPGWDRPGATTFVYDGAGNPRRVGNPQEATPSGDLSGRILLFEPDPALGSYQLTFT